MNYEDKKFAEGKGIDEVEISSPAPRRGADCFGHAARTGLDPFHTNRPGGHQRSYVRQFECLQQSKAEELGGLTRI